MYLKHTAPRLLLSPPVAASLALLVGGALGMAVSGITDITRFTIILIGIVGVVATLTNTDIGILTLAMMTFTRFSEAMSKFYGAPSVITPYLVLVVIALAARLLITRTYPQGWIKVSLLVGAYALLGYASLLWATDVDLAQRTLSDQIKDSSVAILAVLLIQRGSTLQRVVWSIVLVGAFLGTISVYQYITDTYENPYWGFGQAKTSIIVDRSTATEYRIGGPFADSVFYAQLLLLFIPLALDRCWNATRWLLRGVAGYSLGVCLLSLVLTFSRGGFLALVVMIAYIVIRRPPPLRAIILSIMLAVPLMALLPSTYTYRLQTVIDHLPIIGESDLRNDDSFRGRSSEMLAAVMMFGDHPLLGVGLGNYNTRYLEYSRIIGIDPRLQDRSAHSLYLEIGAETGVVGLVVFGVLVAMMFYSLERSYRQQLRAGMHEYANITMAVTAGMIGYLLAAIFLHAAFPRPFWFYFGIAMAIPNVVQYELAQRRLALGQPVIGSGPYDDTAPPRA